MRVVNLINPEFCKRAGEVEFIVEFNILANTVLLMLMSWLVIEISFERLFPRCLIEFTHGRLFPHSFMSFNCLGFLVNTMHLVLHLLGSTSVLNFRLWVPAKFSQMSNIFCNAYSEGAKRRFSSEYRKFHDKTR